MMSVNFKFGKFPMWRHLVGGCPTLVFYCTSLLLLTADRSADAVSLFSQSSQNIGNPAAGNVSIASTESLDDPLEPRAKTFDNFTLNADVTIESLTWRGTFNGPFNPNPSFRGDVDFRIFIYDNLPSNSPDLGQALFSSLLDGGTAAVNDGTQVSESVSTTELQKNGGAVVDYQADIAPLNLDAGSYWLSIVAMQTFPSPHPDDAPTDPNKFLDPTWAWVFASEGDNLLYQFDELFDPSEPGFRFQGGCPGTCDTAFTILGSPQSSGVLGDFDQNGSLTSQDIDILSAQIRAGSTASQYDLNNDGNVNLDDHLFWVEDIFGTLLGDTDLDHDVEFDDFTNLADGFGMTGGWANGDFNGDNIVRFGDFVQLAQNFGLASAEPPSLGAVMASTASVPEPSSGLSLLTVALLAIVRIVRNTRESIDVTVVAAKV